MHVQLRWKFIEIYILHLYMSNKYIIFIAQDVIQRRTNCEFLVSKEDLKSKGEILVSVWLRQIDLSLVVKSKRVFFCFFG